MTVADDHDLHARELFDTFSQSMAGPDRLQRMRSDLIGKDTRIAGQFGSRKLIYADYVASGRALMSVEQFVLSNVLPYYANSHTEASYCGGAMTAFRRVARAIVATCCGASDEYAVIFTGSGSTAGLNRLVNLLGISSSMAAGTRPRVILGPYEHHSNILPWRESGAEIVELREAAKGGPDVDELDAALAGSDARPVVCAFSAASNVTGIISDVAGLTARVNRAGARMVWDYAGGGPYLPIGMKPAIGASIDAVVISPHKFVGGPAASGILIVRRDAVVTDKPTWPGGGTVKFVTPSEHDYSDRLEVREEGGTPNVIGDIRAALAFLVKDAIGLDKMAERNAELRARALKVWSGVDQLELLGNCHAESLSIFSFRIGNRDGGYIHQQLVTQMLSDRFGIQARGGCACAGPYVHRLLRIDEEESARLRRVIAEGDEMQKPGFTRLNLSVLLSDEEADFILRSVAQLAEDATGFVGRYSVEPSRAIFFPRDRLGADEQDGECPTCRG